MVWWNPATWGRTADPNPSLDSLPGPGKTDGGVVGPPQQTALVPRQSVPSDSFLFAGTNYAFLPRRAYHGIQIDKLDISTLPLPFALDILVDLSPEVSNALWNVIHLGMKGVHYEVFDPTGANKDPVGQALLEKFHKEVVETQFGFLNTLVGQLFYSAFIQGAVCVEAGLNETLDAVAGIYPVQPYTIRFQRDSNPPYVVEMYQNQQKATAPVPLSGPNIWYIPVDPAIDDPYGRPPIASILWPVTFDMQFMKDLKQAIHVSGWGRLDVEVVREIAENSAPPAVKGDPKAMKDYLDGILSDVKGAFQSIRPDDTMIHLDTINVKSIDPSGKMFQTQPLLRLIELRMIRALKQLPILMSSNEGTTETHGTVQFEIYSAGMNSMRSVVADIMSAIDELALRMMGHQACVCWGFEEIRIREREAEARASNLEMITALWEWGFGIRSQDEISLERTGHAPVGPVTITLQPPPPPVPGQSSGGTAGQSGGSNVGPSEAELTKALLKFNSELVEHITTQPVEPKRGYFEGTIQRDADGRAIGIRGADVYE